MDSRTPPYIDLTRHLNYPHGSLSPLPSESNRGITAPSAFNPRCPISRRDALEARQAALDFTSSALWLLLLFLIVFSYLLSLCF